MDLLTAITSLTDTGGTVVLAYLIWKLLSNDMHHLNKKMDDVIDLLKQLRDK